MYVWFVGVPPVVPIWSVAPLTVGSLSVPTSVAFSFAMKALLRVGLRLNALPWMTSLRPRIGTAKPLAGRATKSATAIS